MPTVPNGHRSAKHRLPRVFRRRLAAELAETRAELAAARRANTALAAVASERYDAAA